MLRFGLLLLCGVIGLAGPGRADETDDHSGWDEEGSTPDGAERVREKLAAKFDVDESRIDCLRDEKLGYGEIDHALTLADRLPGGITDENVDHVLELRQEQGMGWGQIAHEFDTTLGTAKREFRTGTVPSDGPGAQPRSLSRPGRSALASGRGQAGGRSIARGPSDRPGSRSRAGMRSGGAAGRANGHALGHSASHASGGKASGKARGRK
jgi:hypothetical protein